MRRRIRCSVMILSAAACLRPAARVQAQQYTVAEQYLSMSINAERAAVGLPPLVWNQPLAYAAHQHAERMAAAGIMTHQVNGEPDLSARVTATGVQFPALAENVAVGTSPIQLHGLLMNSPHHRENILDAKVNALGVAVVSWRGQLWVVEDFAFDVPRLPLEEQERRVSDLLRQTGLTSIGTSADARSMCRMSSGFVGDRPAFIMRYTATDLGRLPDDLLDRIGQGRVEHATVGACSGSNGGFYNIAVVLYR